MSGGAKMRPEYWMAIIDAVEEIVSAIFDEDDD